MAVDAARAEITGLARARRSNRLGEVNPVHQKRWLAKSHLHGRSAGVSGPMKLTTREIAILPLLEQGLCNKEIAAALKISVPTVKFHVRNIFSKARAHDRQEVLARAKRNGGPLK